MYEQSLVKVVEPIKKTTITRLNRTKKWKYGYNKEYDIVVISKTGKIGEILEIQGLRIALPVLPVQARWTKTFGALQWYFPLFFVHQVGVKIWLFAFDQDNEIKYEMRQR